MPKNKKGKAVKKNIEKSNVNKEPNKDVRLSKNVTPSLYNLHLKIDLESEVFSGQESINIKIKKKTREIELHSLNLNIKEAYILDAKGSINLSVRENRKKETIILSCHKDIEIESGERKLFINFDGRLESSMRGLYKSTFKYKNKEYKIATTQFEATDARRAFPCFDEPEMKAEFIFSLTSHKGLTFISNEAEVKRETNKDDKNLETVYFKKTPKMSTYLAAFIVGDFEYIESKTKRGTAVRIYTTKGKKSQGKFALEVGVKTLEFYEEYFKVKYPLKKLDMIAVPDFESGAMENWGAVTYRETALLVDPKNTSIFTKQWVALVIAHELAHQWFGNMVTMKWWTDLWLNEGFASYIEYLAVDKIFPEWHIFEDFIVNDLGSALSLDSLLNTHAIEIEVRDPAEIGEIFDSISYAKGASLIRMLADYVGEKDFKKSLQLYIKENAYQNTVTNDLWAAFEKVTGKPIKKMMSTWTQQAGHPVIEVSEVIKDCCVLKQKRFFSSALEEKKYEKNNENKNKNLWTVPVNTNHGEQFILDKREKRIQRGVGNELCPLKLNHLESGVYRVRYQDSQLIDLFDNFSSLTNEDKIGFMRDTTAFMIKGDISCALYIELLEKIKKEKNANLWLEILSGISHIHSSFLTEPWIKKLEEKIKNILGEVYNYLGKEEKTKGKMMESIKDTKLRVSILSTLAYYDDKELIDFAINTYNTKHATKSIQPNMRSFVYVNYVRHGDDKAWTEIKDKYLAEELHEEKRRLGSALGQTRNAKLLKDTLDFALGEDVKSQDSVGLIASVFHNKYGKDIAWSHIRENWAVLYKRYGGKHSLSSLVSILENFNTKEHLTEVKAFFKKVEHKGAERTLKQSIETIEANIYFKKVQEKSLERVYK